MRLAQMAANLQPLTAVATAADLGPPATKNGWDSGDEHGPDPWGNVHFRNKGPLGPRLSAAAMNIVYGNKTVPYRGPEAAKAALASGAAEAMAAATTCADRSAAAAVNETAMASLLVQLERLSSQVLADVPPDPEPRVSGGSTARDE